MPDEVGVRRDAQAEGKGQAQGSNESKAQGERHHEIIKNFETTLAAMDVEFRLMTVDEPSLSMVSGDFPLPRGDTMEWSAQ